MNGNNCKSSILVCVTFYVFTKYLIYVFMQERIHTIRASEYTRMKDLPYVFGMAFVTVGTLAIGIWALLTAGAEMVSNKTCKMGIPPNAATAFLVWDFFLNSFLAVSFVLLLLPTLRLRAQLQTPASLSSFTRHLAGVKSNTINPTTVRMDSARSSTLDPNELVLEQSHQPVVDSLVRLIKKSIIGVFLICIPTAINLGMFIHMQGMETGFECFLTCTLDSESPSVYA
jgi:hypothetical protein